MGKIRPTINTTATAARRGVGQDIVVAGPYNTGVSLDMLSTPAAVKADSGTLGGP